MDAYGAVLFIHLLSLLWMNTATALGIVLAMAAKPGPIGSLAVLGVFAAAGAIYGASRRRVVTPAGAAEAGA